MTHFLLSDEKPDGFKLEDILRTLRKDVLTRCAKIADDGTEEAKHVMDNNMHILNLLTEAINTAEESTQTLDKAFGRSVPGQPRIGTE
jgi:hypothetical protein